MSRERMDRGAARQAPFAKLGEERHARSIAREIVGRRPLSTTAELVDAIRASVPPRPTVSGRGHPAKRTFQAIRIAVNGELDSLDRALPAAWDLLRAGGRLTGDRLPLAGGPPRQALPRRPRPRLRLPARASGLRLRSRAGGGPPRPARRQGVHRPARAVTRVRASARLRAARQVPVPKRGRLMTPAATAAARAARSAPGSQRAPAPSRRTRAAGTAPQPVRPVRATRLGAPAARRIVASECARRDHPRPWRPLWRSRRRTAAAVSNLADTGTPLPRLTRGPALDRDPDDAPGRHRRPERDAAELRRQREHAQPSVRRARARELGASARLACDALHERVAAGGRPPRLNSAPAPGSIRYLTRRRQRAALALKRLAFGKAHPPAPPQPRPAPARASSRRRRRPRPHPRPRRQRQRSLRRPRPPPRPRR